VCLAEQGLADHRGAGARLVRGDRRAQTGATGADHQDVVLVGLILGH